MYDVQGSAKKSGLKQIWDDILHAQRRAAELNTPWVARRRAADQR
jgi:hypothetical protein